MLNVCTALMLFAGTPLVSATPVDCLKWTAFQVAIEEGVDPFLFTAIIDHESKWKVNAYNKRTKDYGLGQVNERNVKALGLDRHKLLTNPEYNLRISATMLRKIHKTYGHEPLWWARYNVGWRKLGPKRQALAHKYALKISKNLNRGLASLN